MSGTFGHGFCQWTRYAFAPAKGCDLVTFFLRRNFQIIKPDRFNAILTTNSIIDGKTREGGLDVIIRDQKGSINFAVRSVKWPGTANLFVSLLGVVKSRWNGPRQLDGRPVDYISPFLEDYEDLGDPRALHQNRDQMFQGSIFLGDGFLLSYAERKRLIAADPKNVDVIFPVINGKEVNNDPSQHPSRCIINFFDWSEERAREYMAPFEIVENTVRPVRDGQNDPGAKERWWQHIRPRIELYRSISEIGGCFIAAATTKYLSFTASRTDMVFLNTLYVYTSDSWFRFAILQSNIHNEWARKYSGALKQDLRYSPSNCFVNFPFPQNLSPETEDTLEHLGETYHEFRRKLMIETQLGLTKIYNQFHNPDLRELTDEEMANIPEFTVAELQKAIRKRDGCPLEAS